MEQEKTVQKNLEQAEDKLFNFRPFLFFAVFFIFGILFAVLCQTREVSFWWLCLLLPLGLPLCFCRTLRRAKYICLGVVSLVFAFALGYNRLFAQTQNFSKGGYYNGEYALSGRVVETSFYNDRICLTIDRLTIDGNSEKGKLVAYLPTTFSKTVDIGDTVLITGRVLTNNRAFNDGTLRAYAVDEYDKYTAYASDCMITGENKGVFLSVRKQMQRVLYLGMDESTAGVVLAILTGNTQEVGDGLLQNIRYGGIAHIFAVSGLHIGALYAFCLLLIQKTKLYKQSAFLRFFAVAGILLFYGGVCGYSSSVIRAIVMCLTLYATKLLGLQSDLAERIGLSGVIVLLLSPVSLCTVGFQLSFTACLGIAWLATPIRNTVYEVCGLDTKEKDKPFGLAKSCMRSAVSFFAVTLSAQVVTAPITYSAFGYISLVSLLLNCLFVPLLSLAFSFVLLLAFLSCLVPSLSVALLLLPNLFFSALLLLFEWVDFSAFAVKGIVLSPARTACYFVALLFLTDKWNISKPLRYALFGLFAIAYIALFFVQNL